MRSEHCSRAGILLFTIGAAYLGFETLSAFAQPEHARLGFDCRRARLAAEFAICDSHALAMRDRELSERYAAALAAAPSADAERIRRRQAQWIVSRNRCGENQACLNRAYDERLRELATSSAPAPTRRVETPPSASSAARAISQDEQGIPIIQNRLALFDRSAHWALMQRPSGASRQDTRNLGEHYEAHLRSWRRMLELFALSKTPDVVRTNDAAAEHILRRYLSPDRRAHLLGSAAQQAGYGDPFERLNQFERRAILERFRREEAPQMLAQARRAPWKVVDIRRVALGPYDFQARRLVISGAEANPRGPTLATPSVIVFEADGQAPRAAIAPLDVRQLPTFATLEPDRAERLLIQLARPGDSHPNQRTAYLAIFATIQDFSRDEPPARFGGGAPGPAQHRFEVQTERIALFADPNLQTELFSVETAPLAAAPPPGRDPLAAAMAPLKPSDAMGLLPVVGEMLGDADFVDRAIRDDHKYRNASEFDRPALQARERARIAAARTAAPWLVGAIRLGEYDVASQSFTVSSLRLRAESKSSSDFGGVINIVLANPRSVEKLEAAAGRAQAAIAHARGQREFLVFARAKPVKAELTNTSRGGLKVRLSVEIDDMFVYADRGVGADPLVVARVSPISVIAPPPPPAPKPDETRPAAPPPAVPAPAPATPVAAAPDNRDVSGVRLGMSFDEADAVIRKHMKVGRVLEAARAPAPESGPVKLFRAARLYISEDAQEFFVIFHEPPAEDRKVIGIVRTQALPIGQVYPQQFKAALIAKYGEPSAAPGTHARRSEWYPDAMKTRWAQCRIEDAEKRDEPAWTENGQPANWRSSNVTTGPAHLYPDPGFHRYLPWPRLVREEPAAAECGVLLAAEHRTEGPWTTGSGYDQISIMLFDVRRAARAFGPARDAIRAAPPRTTPADSETAAKIRL